MAQITLVQEAKLCKLIREIVSSLNVRNGVVGQNMPEIEAELHRLRVSYHAYELSAAVNKLIKQGVLTIDFATDGSTTTRYDKYFVTLMSKI
ncbi:MAG: hypothetical protein HYY55_03205 [Candidatus Niyogibacteria bacterium]|nr:MAG: hypothetical protein HYY55_03205 [Candidatus Niyogibacteria bacterium]